METESVHTAGLVNVYEPLQKFMSSRCLEPHLSYGEDAKDVNRKVNTIYDQNGVLRDLLIF